MAKRTTSKKTSANTTTTSTDKKISITEMRVYAKKVGVTMKGKTADELKEEILDAIEEQVGEAKKKRQGAKWKKENQDLVDFYEMFVNDKAPEVKEEEPDAEEEEIQEEIKKTKKTVKDKKEKKKAKRKEKVAKSREKAKKESTSKGELSCYGHRKDTMTGALDGLISKGTTKEAAVKMLMKDFSRDEDQAGKRFEKHIKKILPGVGIKVELKGKTYKATKASL